ncbi:DinB family protein [Anditalea andensis]|uniref:Damage-inducible protein DinB n=1 Tax=Anditalea andensis TaxID=1048983 RepID=A0A074L494_9BACT|nr:DinB family protein [Anditalea andensis]KEO75305.1 damage-inducible protein DinB [Anditalea andensis]
MTILETFKKELTNESVTTKKMLSLIPADKWQWKPHFKSMNILRLANHIAELPGWIGQVLNHDGLDIGIHPYIPNEFANTSALLAFYDKLYEKAQIDLSAAHDIDLEKVWTLRNGNIIFSTDTKYNMLRMSFSQVIHHRAQLGVYLRMLEVPIPGSYGASADEE